MAPFHLRVRSLLSPHAARTVCATVRLTLPHASVRCSPSPGPHSARTLHPVTTLPQAQDDYATSQDTGHAARRAHTPPGRSVSPPAQAHPHPRTLPPPLVPRDTPHSSSPNVDVEVGCRQPDRLTTTSVGFLVRPATDRAHQLRTPALCLPSVVSGTIRRVCPQLRRTYPPLNSTRRSPPPSPQSRCRSMASPPRA